MQCFLTGAPHPGQPTFRNSLSLDQIVAKTLGLETRFPSLAVSVRKGEHYAYSIAVSRSGVVLPSETSAERLYRRLFVAGTSKEKAATMRRIEAGGSVLDLILDKAKRLEKSTAAEDRARLDQYFQSVGELEGRLQRKIEEAQMNAFGDLLKAFQSINETGGTLLDRTQILYRCCLSNANSHSNQNLPIILAGGGFKHGQHLFLDPTNNTPMANLFVSMLQNLSINVDNFSSSTGTVTGV